MRDAINADLSAHIEKSLVTDLLDSYEELVSKHRSGDLEGALTKAGRFVEHTLRIIEYIRTQKVITEIKSVNKIISQLENKSSLHESLRILIPRVLNGMMYNLRSKRDAVHVKEIDPTPIDLSLTVSAANWVMAELLRLYHKSDEKAVSQAMLALTRTTIPFIETINDETFVGQKIPASMEVLLLLAHAQPNGMTRQNIGKAAKCSQPSVTIALKSLKKERHIHLTAKAEYHITAAGEQVLADWLAGLQS